MAYITYDVIFYTRIVKVDWLHMSSLFSSFNGYRDCKNHYLKVILIPIYSWYRPHFTFHMRIISHAYGRWIFNSGTLRRTINLNIIYRFWIIQGLCMPWRTLDMRLLRWHSNLRNKSNIFFWLNHKRTGKYMKSDDFAIKQSLTGVMWRASWMISKQISCLSKGVVTSKNLNFKRQCGILQQ